MPPCIGGLRVDPRANFYNRLSFDLDIWGPGLNSLENELFATLIFTLQKTIGAKMPAEKKANVHAQLRFRKKLDIWNEMSGLRFQNVRTFYR